MATTLPRMTITIPAPLKRKLTAKAKREHLSESQYIVRLIDKDMKREQKEVQKLSALLTAFRRTKKGTAPAKEAGEALLKELFGE